MIDTESERFSIYNDLLKKTYLVRNISVLELLFLALGHTDVGVIVVKRSLSGSTDDISTQSLEHGNLSE